MGLMGLGFVEWSSAQVKCLLFPEQTLGEHTDPHCKHTDGTSHLTVYNATQASEYTDLLKAHA